MSKKNCREGFGIYKKFLVRMDKVAEFLKVAEVSGSGLVQVRGHIVTRGQMSCCDGFRSCCHKIIRNLTVTRGSGHTVKEVSLYEVVTMLL